MFGFGESQDAYEKVEKGHHATLTHEAIAAAASFEVRYSLHTFTRSLNNASIGHEGIRGPPTP